MRPGVCLLRAGNRTRRPALTHHGNNARGVNALAAPDPRAKALQRGDVRAGRWLINGVINGADSLAEGAARLGSARLGSARLGSARLGYGQGDIAVEALVGTAFQARP